MPNDFRGDFSTSPGDYNSCLVFAIDEAVNRARQIAGDRFDADHPGVSNSEEESELQRRLDSAKDELERLEVKTEKTPQYVRRKEKDPDHKLDFIDVGFGVLVLLLLAFGFFVVPAISTVLLIESQKFPAVADMPTLGLAFGAMALVGYIGSIQFRETLTTDEGERAYDQKIIGIAICLFVIWAVIAALSAFPIEVNAPEGLLDEWGQPQQRIQVEIPLFLFFVSTALLDLAAGPVFHMAAHQRLSPKTITRIVENEFAVALRERLIPDAEANVDLVLQKLSAVRAAAAKHSAARAYFIETEISKFMRRYAAYEAARNSAIAAELSAHNGQSALGGHDSNLRNEADESPLANGHFPS